MSSHHHGATRHSAGGMLSRGTRTFGAALRAMQYARMLRATSQLTDTQLESLGLTRADLPRRAHDSIYGERG